MQKVFVQLYLMVYVLDQLEDVMLEILNNIILFNITYHFNNICNIFCKVEDCGENTPANNTAC